MYIINWMVAGTEVFGDVLNEYDECLKMAEELLGYPVESLDNLLLDKNYNVIKVTPKLDQNSSAIKK